MSLVLLDVTDRVATITFNDPDRRNVFTSDMNTALIPVIDEVEARDDVGAIVVTGNGPHFSAGGHLDDLLDARGDNDKLKMIYDGFLRLAHASIPTVAAVNGAAVGAGMNCVLACDLIIAGEGSRFDSRFLQIAIHPGGGHTWRLRNRTDLQTVNAMVLFNEILSGPRAAEIGLAWRCVPDAELVSTAQEMAAKAASAPKGLSQKAKATIQATQSVMESLESMELELEPQGWSMVQPEFEEFVDRLKSRIAAKK